jgi:hypothetical protein
MINLQKGIFLSNLVFLSLFTPVIISLSLRLYCILHLNISFSISIPCVLFSLSLSILLSTHHLLLSLSRTLLFSLPVLPYSPSFNPLQSHSIQSPPFSYPYSPPYPFPFSLHRYCDAKPSAFGQKADVRGSSNEAELKLLMEGVYGRLSTALCTVRNTQLVHVT